MSAIWLALDNRTCRCHRENLLEMPSSNSFPLVLVLGAGASDDAPQSRVLLATFLHCY